MRIGRGMIFVQTLLQKINYANFLHTCIKYYICESMQRHLSQSLISTFDQQILDFFEIFMPPKQKLCIDTTSNLIKLFVKLQPFISYFTPSSPHCTGNSDFNHSNLTAARTYHTATEFTKNISNFQEILFAGFAKHNKSILSPLNFAAKVNLRFSKRRVTKIHIYILAMW